jgi:DNA-binding MarR family transcriptional regulator
VPLETALRIEARDDATSEEPATTGGELLDELTAWSPSDRAGMFRNWHRGAFSLIQLNVVAVLEAEGPLPMGRLADELDVSVASATGIVDRMEHRGLIERRHATDDRRVVVVHLTERGAGIFRDMAARRREHLARMFGELTEDELAGLLNGIRAIRAARQRLGDAHEQHEQETVPDCGPTGTAVSKSQPAEAESGDPDR